MSYDERTAGDFGWLFLNAGTQYRKLDGVTAEEQLMMTGIFKQATMGDCLCEESKKNEIENRQRAEWMKYKGLDNFEAMQLYIEKVKGLASRYKERAEPTPGEAAKKGKK